MKLGQKVRLGFIAIMIFFIFLGVTQIRDAIEDLKPGPCAEKPPLTAPPKRDTIFITDTLTLIEQKHMELAETQIGMGYMGSPEHLKEGD